MTRERNRPWGRGGTWSWSRTRSQTRLLIGVGIGVGRGVGLGVELGRTQSQTWGQTQTRPMTLSDSGSKEGSESEWDSDSKWIRCRTRYRMIGSVINMMVNISYCKVQIKPKSCQVLDILIMHNFTQKNHFFVERFRRTTPLHVSARRRTQSRSRPWGRVGVGYGVGHGLGVRGRLGFRDRLGVGVGGVELRVEVGRGWS